MSDSFGKILIITGIVMIIVGILILIAQKSFGSEEIPGTIKISTRNFTVFFPILASIVISVILSFVLNLAFRFLK